MYIDAHDLMNIVENETKSGTGYTSHKLNELLTRTVSVPAGVYVINGVKMVVK